MTLKDITTELGEILERKNAAYGNSAEDSITFLRLLYPNGIQPDRYQDILYTTRIFDKLKRLATDPDAFGEDAALDLAGYAVLWVRNRRQGKAWDKVQNVVDNQTLVAEEVGVKPIRTCPNCEGSTGESAGTCWPCYHDRHPGTNWDTSWKNTACKRELREMAKRGVS